MPIWIIAMVAAIALATGATTGYKYATYRCEAEKAEALKAAMDAKDEAIRLFQDTSVEYEAKLATANKQRKVITKLVEKEIEKPVYRECVFPASGMQLINDTATTLNTTRAAGELNGAVRGHSTDRHRNTESKNAS